MERLLEYKGYHTKIDYNVDDKVYFGKIEGINDLVNFEARKIEEVEEAFHSAVDDYVTVCKETGTLPSKR